VNPVFQGLLTILIGVGGIFAYFVLSNMLLDKVLFPAKGPNASRNINRANLIRPWLFLGPPIIARAGYVVYPVMG
jgi:alpha-glucoside transport system permease protein